MSAASSTAARFAKMAAISPAASPMATTARTRPAAVASGVRSSPLLRPPAMSTGSGRAATAARAAWGVVADESS